MPRLPHPGADKGNWGTILNEYLSVSHDNDGTLKSSTVGTAQLQPNAVTSAALTDGSVTTSKIAAHAVTPAKLQGVGQANGLATLDGDGKLLEQQVPERLTDAQLSAAIADEVSSAFSEYTFMVDNYPSVTAAYAALVAAGGGVLQFTQGKTYTGVNLMITSAVPTHIFAYGAIIKPAANSVAFTFNAGRSQSQIIALHGANIDCAGLTAGGVVIRDHYGAVLNDVRINAPTVGVLVTDATGWTESSQLSNVYVKAATVAGFDFQTAGGTGSFGYASWGLVHADNIPSGAVGFRVGAGASLANSTFAQIVLHSTANGATGLSVLGDMGYHVRIDAVVEALASVMTGSTAITIGPSGTLGGADFNCNIINPSGGGGWGTNINNPSNRPFQIRTPRNMKIAAAVNQAIEQSGVLFDTQPMFSRSPDGTLRWGPGGSTATDVTLTRAGVGFMSLTGSLQLSGSLNMFGGMRLASGVTTTSGSLGTGAAPLTLADASAASIVRTLGTTTTPGIRIEVIKVDASGNTVTIAPPASGSINGSSSSIVLSALGDRAVFDSTPTSGVWMGKKL